MRLDKAGSEAGPRRDRQGIRFAEQAVRGDAVRGRAQSGARAPAPATSSWAIHLPGSRRLVDRASATLGEAASGARDRILLRERGGLHLGRRREVRRHRTAGSIFPRRRPADGPRRRPIVAGVTVVAPDGATADAPRHGGLLCAGAGDRGLTLVSTRSRGVPKPGSSAETPEGDRTCSRVRRWGEIAKCPRGAANEPGMDSQAREARLRRVATPRKFSITMGPSTVGRRYRQGC